jgi:hypothetical protein
MSAAVQRRTLVLRFIDCSFIMRNACLVLPLRLPLRR